MQKAGLWALIVCASTLSGCIATGGGPSSSAGSVGDYAMGDDSAAIKSGRNRRSAQLSRAELDQHRRQRTNVSEELDLESKKRRAKKEETDDSLSTINGTVGTLRNLRSFGRGW